MIKAFFGYRQMISEYNLALNTLCVNGCPCLCCVVNMGCIAAGHSAVRCGEPFSEARTTKGCSLHPRCCTRSQHAVIQRVHQGAENTQTQNAFELFIHGLAVVRVSTASQSCFLGQPGRTLQSDPSPAITAAWHGFGWVVIACTVMGQRG